MLGLREPSEYHMQSFDGKTLMITGGTGTFGKTVLKRFLSTDVERIIIFSRDEKKQEDLRIQLRNSKVSFAWGDVRSLDSIQQSMRGVDSVSYTHLDVYKRQG